MGCFGAPLYVCERLRERTIMLRLFSEGSSRDHFSAVTRRPAAATEGRAVEPALAFGPAHPQLTIEPEVAGEAFSSLLFAAWETMY